MEAIIHYVSNIIVEGDTLADIKEKFENMPLYPVDLTDDNPSVFCGVIMVLDNDTRKDITDNYNKC